MLSFTKYPPQFALPTVLLFWPHRVDEAILDGSVLPASRLQPRSQPEAVMHPVQQRVRVDDHQSA